MRRAVLAFLVASCLVACGGGGGGDDEMCLGDDTPDNGGCDPDDEPDLATTENTWVWVPFTSTQCGNGTPAGIALNRTTASDDLFVYFSGGGACWDYETCFGAQPTSIHLDEELTSSVVVQEASFLPTARVAANPFVNATIVFVPYCTGDVHTGANVGTYMGAGGARSLHHVGATNTTTFVNALKAQFPAAQNVWVSGSSAGGYGSAMNFHKFTGAWPDAEVHLLADASPFVTPMGNYTAWKEQWSMQYPPGCADCGSDFSAVVDTLGAQNPDSRIGFMFFDNDATIRAYFGYGSLVDASNDLLDNHFSQPNTKAFVAAGEAHVMFTLINTLTGPNGVTLQSWVSAWLSGSGWTTVRP